MRIETGTPADLGAWMALMEQVAWNFPGLETPEALAEHRQTVLQRTLLDRRRAQLHTAPLGLVRLGEHADDVEPFIYQFFQ